MLTYLSHTGPFGCEAFSFACVFSGDVNDGPFWCPRGRVFNSIVRGLNENGFGKKKQNQEVTIK